MTITVPYRFALFLFRKEDGASLGGVPVNRDWEPLCDYARIYFQRRGDLALESDNAVSILPVWDGTAGEPFCRGYQVEFLRPDQPPLAAEFPITHFQDLASAAASLCVEQGKLRDGERYFYFLEAYPTLLAPKTGGRELCVRNASPGLPARDGSLTSLMARAEPYGSDDGHSDLPVFVSHRVLDQISERTHAEEGKETGGILIGTLWRDAAAREIFAEVSAQIPAEHTIGDDVTLRFTPQTWTAADAALQLRGRGELYLGYWHSHPVREWRKASAAAPQEQKARGLESDFFFSASDEAVMRAAFPRAFHIAIVANDTAPNEVIFKMYGNRQGALVEREFYVLEDEENGR